MTTKTALAVPYRCKNGCRFCEPQVIAYKQDPKMVYPKT